MLLLLAMSLAVPDAEARRKRGPTVLERVTAEQVAAQLRAAGSNVEIMTDGYGDPLIRAENRGRAYSVLFYECAPEGCQALQFRAWWKAGRAYSAEELNEFNRTARNGAVYLDTDRDPTLDLIWMANGGTTMENLTEVHRAYLATFDKFQREVVNTE